MTLNIINKGVSNRKRRKGVKDSLSKNRNVEKLTLGKKKSTLKGLKSLNTLKTNKRKLVKKSALVITKVVKTVEAVKRPVRETTLKLKEGKVKRYRGIAKYGDIHRKPLKKGNGRSLIVGVGQKRKKVKRYQGVCYITQTRNNMFVVFMAAGASKVLVELSSGKVGTKGVSKRTRLTSVLIGREVGKRAKTLDYKSVAVHIRGGITGLVRSVITGLGQGGLVVAEINFRRSIAHNGVRLSKARRK